MNYSISQIASILDFAILQGTATPTIAWFITDSRTLTFPETTLFFAISSPYRDAHQFIAELYERGVRAFVIEETNSILYNREYPDAVFLIVKTPHTVLEALQTIACHHRHLFKEVEVVGITGSNGKTIVKEWIYQIISDKYNVARSPRSFNSQVGVPLSVSLLKSSTEIALFEAGISQPHEMQALRKMICPTLGIFTHLGEAHQEGFVSTEEKVREKLNLFTSVKQFIYCADNKVVTKGVQDLQKGGFEGKAFGWSRMHKNAPLYIEEVRSNNEETTLSYRLNIKPFSRETHTIQVPFTDEANIENAITTLFACLLFFKCTPQFLAVQIPKLEPIGMRLEVKQGNNNCTIINDAYNNDITGLEIALNFMERRAIPSRYQKVLVLSDILQSGMTDIQITQEVGRLIAKHDLHRLFTIGSQWMTLQKHLPKHVIWHHFTTTKTLLASRELQALKESLILVKGARSFGFERIVEYLAQRVHETTLEIDLEAVGENLKFYRSFLSPDTKMMCMIKASAYGTGAVEIAKTLEDRGVDYLAVAVADEGAELRKAGVKGNIIVMNPEMSSFDILFQYHLEPEVYSFALLRALQQAAKREGITNFPIHIKLDTGMSRLGFDPEEDPPHLIDFLHHQKALIVRSVFSHFAGSDSAEFDDFSSKQFERFERGATSLQAAFSHKILRHICNSAGIIRFPERHLDMVRLGLGLYGINPIDNSILHPVATLRTTILQIHSIDTSTTVGYSRRGKVYRSSRIAAIPIGYADGLNRHLGNGHAYCLVNGQAAPYIGNICMDVCMIDVTDIHCKEGDEVEIFGRHLSVTTLSDKLQTIPYEILTNISERVKRVYVQ